MSGQTNKLHTLNMMIAAVAGVVSILGSVYSLRANFFHKEPTVSYGSIMGCVRDEKLAKPLRLATVEIFISGSDESVSILTTDDEGLYKLESLKEGKYRVQASAVRHESQTKKIVVEKDMTSNVDFSLPPIEEVQEQPVSPVVINPSPSTVPSFQAAPPVSSVPVYTPAGYQPASSYSGERGTPPPPFGSTYSEPPPSSQYPRYQNAPYGQRDTNNTYYTRSRSPYGTQQTNQQQPSMLQTGVALLGQMMTSKKSDGSTSSSQTSTSSQNNG